MIGPASLSSLILHHCPSHPCNGHQLLCQPGRSSASLVALVVSPLPTLSHCTWFRSGQGTQAVPIWFHPITSRATNTEGQLSWWGWLPMGFSDEDVVSISSRTLLCHAESSSAFSIGASAHKLSVILPESLWQQQNDSPEHHPGLSTARQNVLPQDGNRGMKQFA